MGLDSSGADLSFQQECTELFCLFVTSIALDNALEHICGKLSTSWTLRARSVQVSLAGNTPVILISNDTAVIFSSATPRYLLASRSTRRSSGKEMYAEHDQG